MRDVAAAAAAEAAASDAAADGDAGGAAPAALDCAAPRVFLRADLAWVAPALQEGLAALQAAVAAQRAAAAAVAGALAASGGGDACAAPARALTASLPAALHALALASADVPFAEVLTCYYAQRLHEFAAAVGRPAPADSDEEGAEEEEAGDDAMEDDGEGGDAADAAAGAAGVEGGAGDDAMEGVEGGAAEGGCAGAPDAAWRGALARCTAALGALGLGALAEEAAAAAVAAAVRARLQARCRGVFDAPCLAPARAWLAAVPLRFLATLLPALHGARGGAAALAAWRARAHHALHTALGALRTHELFDIVVDFPDSRAAVEDLRACLAATSLAAPLAASFRAALQRRLLHPGAATADILAQYVSCIRALRELEPAGTILEAVSGPLRAYLRSRRDTIRCVVSLLTDAGGGEAGEGASLMEELAARDGGAGGGDSDAEGDAPPRDAAWDAWQPPPALDAAAAGGGDAAPQQPPPVHGGAAARSADTVALLVGVFGSRDLFCAEFRAALAERLLARPLGSEGYDAERDVRCCELLKLRFGDAALHAAEVMLKDVADSKRTDGNVKAASGLAGAAPVEGHAAIAACGLSATVLSALFWPPLAPDAAPDLALPPPVESALSAYAARFEQLKAPRKLGWRRALGCVRLELALGGAVRAFVVSPAHAALIWAFADRDAWPAAALAAALRCPPAALRAKAALWLSAGVLLESRDAAGALTYTVADAFPDAEGGGGGGAAAAGEPGGGAVASAEDVAAAEMAVYEQYVLGMLSNFEALPLARIHNFLKMFVAEPAYDKSAAQLEALLGRMVAQEKLALDGGVYRKRA
jgi:anaphase-promoting complex subunit 2